jgi:CubicO group peptidase (beta-lactamase class C family)
LWGDSRIRADRNRVENEVTVDSSGTQPFLCNDPVDYGTRMELQDFLRREVELGSFPGASFATGTTAGLTRLGALGNAVAVPLRIPATVETLYDCASITKPLITTPLVLQAVAEGRIRLDDEYRGFTFRELLSHSSGLKAWLPLYAMGDYLRAIEEHGVERPRGESVVYSDLNFALLYFALTEIFGDYVKAAQERIFDRLGLRDSLFRPPVSLLPRIAATEWGQRFEAGMCAVRSIPFHGFRQGLMWGEPNDGNSWGAGGTVGNAGLFATARDVFRIAQAFAAGELVPMELVREATREQADGRGLGWALGGPSVADDAYGHTGFTGTSVWIEDERIYVLLTNRVHPCAAPIGMTSIRGRFHELARASV